MFDDITHEAHFGIGSFGSAKTDDTPRPLDPCGRDGAPQRGSATEHLQLIGTHLRAEGSVDLGRFSRLSDYVNLLGGFFNIRDVTLLSRVGAPTRVTFPELRVRLGDIAIVAQSEGTPPPASGAIAVIPKQPRRLVVMTNAHIVYGSVYLHEQGAMSAFIESPDPHFIPMTGVRVRWLADRRLAGRFPFALLQRSHIIGVASEGHEVIQLPEPGPGLPTRRQLAVGG